MNATETSDFNINVIVHKVIFFQKFDNTCGLRNFTPFISKTYQVTTGHEHLWYSTLDLISLMINLELVLGQTDIIWQALANSRSLYDNLNSLSSVILFNNC